jgi:hypothetical protein
VPIGSHTRIGGILIGGSIEAELRLLVRQVSERAVQGGGLDRRTYDALRAASAALSSKAPTSDDRGREEAFHGMQARLCACEAEPYVEAA